MLAFRAVTRIFANHGDTESRSSFNYFLCVFVSPWFKSFLPRVGLSKLGNCQCGLQNLLISLESRVTFESALKKNSNAFLILGFADGMQQCHVWRALRADRVAADQHNLLS